MKLLLSYFMFFSLSPLYAEVVPLPRGGELRLDSKDWKVHELKEFGTSTLVFTHKNHKDLSAVVLDGTVKEKGECAEQKTLVCDRQIPMGDKISYQIISQKYHGEKAYQNYILAFTVARSREAEILPVLKKLKSQLEMKK